MLLKLIGVLDVVEWDMIDAKASRDEIKCVNPTD